MKGKGRGIVVATSMETQMGKIAESLDKEKGQQTTKLQKTMDKLGLFCVVCAVLCLAVVLFTVWGYGRLPVYPDGLRYAVTVGVSIIPSSLVAVLTLTMALGVRRMANANAIVRKITALETLGSVSDICSDKTGTLTEGKMAVKNIWLPGDHLYTITNDVAENNNNATESSEKVVHANEKEQSDHVITVENQPLPKSSDPFHKCIKYNDNIINDLPLSLQMLTTVAALCNTSSIITQQDMKSKVAEEKSQESHIEVNEQTEENSKKEEVEKKVRKRHWISKIVKRRESKEKDPHKSMGPQSADYEATGDPTEIALNLFARSCERSRSVLEETQYPHMIREFPFDSTVKKMSVVYESNLDKENLYILTKGAPDRILQVCSHYLKEEDPVAESESSVDQLNDRTAELDDEKKKEFMQGNDKLAAEGMRVLALCYKTIPISDKDAIAHANREELVNDLVFIGFVGIQDPPREGVAEAIETCRKAGITVRMVTGDHISTATAIAKQIGIINEEHDDESVMKAADFDQLTESQLSERKGLPLVIARCSPNTKVKMIKSLHNKSKKKIVAMTGDGVNDAASIAASDVGIAMGKNGSDVTKEASDIVLADDNFVTIVSAVRDGRRIFDNIRKFVIHLLTGNIAQVITLMVPLFMGLDLPLNPIQVLWMLLITGTPPAMGLGVEPASRYIMDKKKRKVNERLWSVETIIDIFVYGIWMGGITLVTYFCMTFAWLRRELESAQATTFTVLVVLLLFHVYNCRSLRRSFFRDRFYKSYWLHLSVLLGICTQVIALYVPGLNSEVFRHNPMAGDEWIFVVASLVTFMVGVEIYKLVKRLFIHIIGNRIAKRLEERKHKQKALKKQKEAAMAQVIPPPGAVPEIVIGTS